MNECFASRRLVGVLLAVLLACGAPQGGGGDAGDDAGTTGGGGGAGADAGATGGGGGSGSDGGATGGGTAADAGATGGGGGSATGGGAGGDAGTGGGGGGAGPVVEGDDLGECADGLDNDGDGLTDCAESACANKLCRRVANTCDTPEFCTNGACPPDPSLVPVLYRGLGLGPSNSCAITEAGALRCWGSIGWGQLDGGNGGIRPRPTQVTGLASGVAAVVSGGMHACALTSAGGVKCWGLNAYGQLGNGSMTDRATPSDVSGLTSGVTALAAGLNHVCALTTAGGVKCWGNGSSGQLGNGGSTPSPTPVDVSGLSSGVASIAAGLDHTCAVTTAGAAKCWGDNAGGTLGNGTLVPAAVPQDVSGLSSSVSSIATGSYHTCAVTTAGGVKCWGLDDEGQLGDGATNTASTVPVDVPSLATGVAALSAGPGHTCALLTTGGLKCWGANEAGQIGDRNLPMSGTPVDVWGLTSGLAAVSAGALHTCALTTGGLIQCWGQNAQGQLGDGTTELRGPVDHLGLSDLAELSGGRTHACARTTSGGVLCWGHNGVGELGNGTTLHSAGPVSVTGLASGVVAVRAAALSTSPGFSCALTTAGALKCWGSNAGGQLGDGTTTDRSTPVDVSGLGSGVTAFTLGGGHACALTTGGAVKCWGYGFVGQLGHGTRTSSTTPVAVSGLGSGVVALSAGEAHTCALMTGGAVKCWGASDRGQLGTGSAGDYGVPFPVDATAPGGPASVVAAAAKHTCVITTTGVTRCWGSNNCTLCSGIDPYCRESCGFAVDAPVPTGSTALAAGGRQSCVLTPTGAVQCWGTATSTFPAGTPAFVSLSAGSEHACALRADGTAMCWGHDEWALASGTYSWALRQVCN